MHFLHVVVGLFVLVGLLTPASANELVGVTRMALVAPVSGRELTLSIWYPARAGGETILVGDSALFVGTKALNNAPVADGKFPVVLVSHGGMRSAPDTSAWIAARLAADGYVAVAVQGPKLGRNDAHRAVAEIWERPADLSAALDVVMNDPQWSSHIDSKRIAALGFFLGATSVISLAGGRFNEKRFVRTCDEGGDGVDCAWFAAHNVGLRDADVASLVQSRRDPRIGAVIAVAPEYAGSFTPDSLNEIEISTRIVDLDRPERRTPGLNASALRSSAPRMDYVALPEATQFDAFSACKPKGAAILLEEEGGDAMCRTGAGPERLAAHGAIEVVVREFLDRRFK